MSLSNSANHNLEVSPNGRKGSLVIDIESSEAKLLWVCSIHKLVLLVRPVFVCWRSHSAGRLGLSLLDVGCILHPDNSLLARWTTLYVSVVVLRRPCQVMISRLQSFWLRFNLHFLCQNFILLDISQHAKSLRWDQTTDNFLRHVLSACPQQLF